MIFQYWISKIYYIIKSVNGEFYLYKPDIFIRLMKEHNKENLTNLTDFLGTTLKYGDKVVFCDPGESRKSLEHGTVVGFTNKRIYVVYGDRNSEILKDSRDVVLNYYFMN